MNIPILKTYLSIYYLHTFILVVMFFFVRGHIYNYPWLHSAVICVIKGLLSYLFSLIYFLYFFLLSFLFSVSQAAWKSSIIMKNMHNLFKHIFFLLQYYLARLTPAVKFTDYFWNTLRLYILCFIKNIMKFICDSLEGSLVIGRW